ncbi:MAG TPA: MBOAT family O-acyltransferase [Polyangiaceae bacterium]|nr:MBOAT family O-acyltransferase [Polyangiaceae bacterium]
MIFNSLEFLVFLPVVLGLYFAIGPRLQNLLLLIAGYVFYGAWDVRFLYLVSVSTVLDFCTGLMIGNGRMTRRQRITPSLHVLSFAAVFLVVDWRAVSLDRGTLQIDWVRLSTPTSFGLTVLGLTALIVGLAHALYPVFERMPEPKKRLFFLRCSLFGQLGMLGVFKYYNFFVDSADALATRCGFSAQVLHLNLILPIGISFYTFQTLSYVLDVYWGRMKPAEHLRDFALFVSYFPPLVAGPIERASHLLPRILGERKVTFDNFAKGAFLIAVGLVKKVAIADGLAGTVASVYDSSGAVGFTDVAVGTAVFAFQIYGDFSGYSDIASGVSLFFGIELLKNFDHPYFSINPSEFWRRWHISLSSWLRDYLYIPLGGNRGSEARTYRNLMLTMVLGGLWHGAAWNFVLWGAYQGLLLVAHRAIVGPGARPFTGSFLARLPRMAFFFVFICYGWLLFRASSFKRVVEFTRVLVSDFSDLGLHLKMPPASALFGLLVLGMIEVLQFQTETPFFHLRLRAPVRGLLFAVVVLAFILGSSNEAQQFIYFQF